VQALTLLPPNPGEEIKRRWLQNTLTWLLNVPAPIRTVRLRQIAEGLQQQPSVQARFQDIWKGAFAPRLLSEAGLPEATSLTGEIIERVKRRLLPQVEDRLDLYEALRAAGLVDADARWIAKLSDDDVAPWRALITEEACDFGVAIRLLATRAAAIGLSRAVMNVMPHGRETESPFFSLAEAAASYARSPGASQVREQLSEVILECRVSAGLSHARLEEVGVSSDLVFRLDLLISQLERMDLLVRVASGEQDGREFAAMLVRGCTEERGLHSLVRNSVNRVAGRIVTHTGKTGEHYIANSRAEWSRMGYGALGAGVITAFTALMKYKFASMALAPLWVGIAHSLNYTVSFVLMQFLGWSLASKMPSMTSAALCGALEKDDGMRSGVNLVAAITRSQSIVTLGNLAGSIPVALLIGLFLPWVTGHPFLENEVAIHGLKTMNPLRSLTIPFAAMTGLFLWISSLIAGWTANWMVFNRLPMAVAQSRRIRRAIDAEHAAKLAHVLEHHLSGVVGYVCLGLLLGLLPFISVFAGVPVEVRHITLASASVAYDVTAILWSGPMPWGDLGWAVLGPFATALLNFSVSFALGLWLAVRARMLSAGGRRKLARALWIEVRRNPAWFLWRH
jgi:site-specific recombinase